MGHFPIRTDLALESRERCEADKEEMRGVTFEEWHDEKRNVIITKVKIETENGAKSIGKPIGTYLTLEAPDMVQPDEGSHREVSEVLAEQLRELALDGLVERIQYNTIPLKVEYVLTRQGRELMPILDSLYIWSIRRMHELGISIDPDAFVVHTGDAFSEALGDIMADLGYDEDGLPVEKETTEDSEHE